MELGATACSSSSPKCADCPARAHCLARLAGGDVCAYPRKAEKAAKKSVRSGKSGTEKAGGSGRKGNESARGTEGEREQKEQ